LDTRLPDALNNTILYYMEQWIIYALIVAILVAFRDVFTKHIITKYTTTEHLLYLYILCGIFIISYALYQHLWGNETVRCIEYTDIWKYALFAFFTIAIIAPCQTLSLKQCDNPGQARSVMSLSILFAFILGVWFFRQSAFSTRKLFGVLLTMTGIYFVV
jgi:drug/metabolite transporter (DMT)-like permease